jgi:hypothetical protein
MLGRMEEGEQILDQLESQETRIGQLYSIARCSITRAWVEFGKAGDLTKLQTASQEALKST